MPIVEVKIYDRRVTEESVPKIIEAMTAALAESSGAAREHIQVLVHGVSPNLGPQIRYAVFFRLFHDEHDPAAISALGDLWRSWPGLR